MKGILKARTQMVEIMCRYFDSNLSESHRSKLYILKLLGPRFKNWNMCPTRKYVQTHSRSTTPVSSVRQIVHSGKSVSVVHLSAMYAVKRTGDACGLSCCIPVLVRTLECRQPCNNGTVFFEKWGECHALSRVRIKFFWGID